MFRRLAIGLCLFVAAARPALADEAATVVFFSGQPLVIAASGTTRPMARGERIAAGETVDSADGRVQLRFRDGASMSLQPATRFRVDRFRYAGGDPVAGDGVLMTLLKGGLRTVTGWLGKKDRAQYRIDTTVATIGIRGTEFGAVLDETGLLVTTYGGLVEVCSEVACRDVAPSETVWVRAAGMRPQLREAPPGRPLRSDGVIPETPVVRELPPMQPVQPPPHSPPHSPPPTSPSYY